MSSNDSHVKPGANSTDSFYGGGNPWLFVRKDFTKAVWKTRKTDRKNYNKRRKAINKLNRWDGHFVISGKKQWASGEERSKAWVLMDLWIDEVIEMTFSDELSVDDGDNGTVLKESFRVLFNVLLHGLNYPGSLENNYNWFQNLDDLSAPQNAEELIVAALDKVLDQWDDLPAEKFEIINSNFYVRLLCVLIGSNMTIW